MMEMENLNNEKSGTKHFFLFFLSLVEFGKGEDGEEFGAFNSGNVKT